MLIQYCVLILNAIGYIDITGINSSDTSSNKEMMHLDQVCEKTQSALDGASPSTVTNAPTMKPIQNVCSLLVLNCKFFIFLCLN